MQSLHEPPHEQGAPFLKFRQTANPERTSSKMTMRAEDMFINQAPFLSGRTIIHRHQISTRIVTAVQKPNPPPFTNKPIW